MINVIVPMYNASKYITRCIDSVKQQTEHNWNMIIVDDGSKDTSLTLAQEYAEKDSRIKVYHQENKGAGAARNLAIGKLVGGGYTLFIDSDDYIEKNYFELLSHHEEDIVYIDILRHDVDSNSECVEAISKYSGLCKDKFIRCQMTGKILWGGVRKAVKTDILISHSIKFSNQKIGEEAIYSFDVLYHSNSIGFISKPVYRYEVRCDSLSHSPTDDPWGPVAIEMRNKLQRSGLYSEFANTVNAFLYAATAVSLVRIAKKYSGKEYRLKAKDRIAQLNAELDNSVKYDNESLSVKVKVLIPLIRTKSLFLLKFVGKLK